MNPELCSLLESASLVRRRDHPDLRGSLDRALRSGELTSILPGVLTSPDLADDFTVRASAVGVWDPDAVICGAAAARLSFWPRVKVGQIAVATTRRARVEHRGFRLLRTRVDPDLVAESEGLRITVPALTALDLAHLGDNGAGIDEALRTGVATLVDLHDTLRLTSGRVGNRTRAEILADSRDKPWSEAERLTHRIFRTAGLTGWLTNVPVFLAEALYFLDIAFPEIKVAIEIDGWEHHSSREAFENDRTRQNALVTGGWCVLRFTWRMLIDHPEHLVEQVRRVIALQIDRDRCLSILG